MAEKVRQSWDACRFGSGNLDVSEVMKSGNVLPAGDVLPGNKITAHYFCINPEVIDLGVYDQTRVIHPTQGIRPAAVLYRLQTSDCTSSEPELLRMLSRAGVVWSCIRCPFYQLK